MPHRKDDRVGQTASQLLPDFVRGGLHPGVDEGMVDVAGVDGARGRGLQHGPGGLTAGAGHGAQLGTVGGDLRLLHGGGMGRDVDGGVNASAGRVGRQTAPGIAGGILHNMPHSCRC